MSCARLRDGHCRPLSWTDPAANGEALLVACSNLLHELIQAAGFKRHVDTDPSNPQCRLADAVLHPGRKLQLAPSSPNGHGNLKGRHSGHHCDRRVYNTDLVGQTRLSIPKVLISRPQLSAYGSRIQCYPNIVCRPALPAPSAEWRLAQSASYFPYDRRYTMQESR